MEVQLSKKTQFIKNGEKLALINAYSEKTVNIKSNVKYDENKHILETNKELCDVIKKCNMHIDGMQLSKLGLLDNKLSTLYIMATMNCNLNCDFCCMSIHDDFRTPINLEYDKLEVMLHKLRHHEINKIVITGGEPLMNKTLLDIIKLINNKFPNSKIILCTNGLLMDGEFINRVQGMIHEIEVSCESIFSQYENEQKRFEEILKDVGKLNVRKSFSFVVTPETKKGLPYYIDLCVKHRAKPSIRIVKNINSNINSVMTNEEVLDTYTDILKYIIDKEYNDKILDSLIMIGLIPKMGCGVVNKNTICLYPNGEVYVCPNLLEKKYKLGSIDSDLVSINKEIEKIGAKDSEFYIDNRAFCSNCEVRYICGGECGGINNKVQEQQPVDCIFKKKLIHFRLFLYDPSESTINNIIACYEFLNKASNRITNNWGG